MTKKPAQSPLSQAAVELDQELHRFDELSAQALRARLDSEKNLARATEALQRAAASQDQISALVKKLVEAVASARQKQEQDASALVARARQIAARRLQFAEVLQRMGALGQMAKEAQALLASEGPPRLEEARARMDRIAEEAGEIARAAQAQEIEDLAREAESLRKQMLAAVNRLALLGGRAAP